MNGQKGHECDVAPMALFILDMSGFPLVISAVGKLL